ncbi:MAG: radical SAM protein [Alphaproteobacteria bacterium]|nr:radical SAM protein [Alphaproteobacteria bacterium]
MTDLSPLVLAGIRAGRPLVGPQNVHVDVTNTCNAKCITCWDHSPLLDTPRTREWKQQTLPWERFEEVLAALDRMGSCRAVVLSGMGEPLLHPRIYDMMAEVKRRGWHLTVLSNLVAADIERLATAGVDNLLVGVHGATPDAYMAFHPGWTELQFTTLQSHLRKLVRAGVSTRHVQVINRDTAPDFVQMVRFGHRFRAERINYKLASLAGGTETTAITEDQRAWLREEAVPRARELAAELGVKTNLHLFERQIGTDSALTTTPMDEVGCYMGYVYTRIAVDGTVLFCCNTNVEVGHLREGPLDALWEGDRWQALRERIGRHEWLTGCERCGKFEQNVKWAERLRA